MGVVGLPELSPTPSRQRIPGALSSLSSVPRPHWLPRDTMRQALQVRIVKKS